MREDALPGTVVVQLEVQDYDLGGGALDGEVGQGIIYYLTAGNALQHFHVRSGGQIYVAKKLDREVVDQYALEVTATDGVFVAKAWVFIEILDVNGECGRIFFNVLLLFFVFMANFLSWFIEIFSYRLKQVNGILNCVYVLLFFPTRTSSFQIMGPCVQRPCTATPSARQLSPAPTY